MAVDKHSRIVIRYKETFALDMDGNEVYWRYAICRADHRGNIYPKECTRAEAREYIREHGLVAVQRDENGTVWDTPDYAFRRAWRHNYNDIKTVEKLRPNHHESV